jgi:GDYXXLXY protein
MTGSFSMARRAAFAGALCVAVLGASLVMHAWPLWTGRPMLLRVKPIDPRDPFRGEYVWLAIEEQHVKFTDAPGVLGVSVRPLGSWWQPGLAYPESQPWRDRPMFVQFEPRQEGALVVSHAVSISDAPVAGALNLRGLVRYGDGTMMALDYGVDAFYVQEGRAAGIQSDLRADRPVYAEVMVASSGRARLRRLLRADGSVIAD